MSSNGRFSSSKCEPVSSSSLTPLSEDVLGAVLLFIEVKDIVTCVPLVCRRFYITARSDMLWDFLYHRDVPALFRAIVAQNVILTTQTALSPPTFVPRKFIGWDEDPEVGTEDDGDDDSSRSTDQDQEEEHLLPDGGDVAKLLPDSAPSDHAALGPRQLHFTHRGTRLLYYAPMTGCPSGYSGGGVICNVCGKAVALSTEYFYHRRWFPGMLAPQFDYCQRCVEASVIREVSGRGGEVHSVPRATGFLKVVGDVHAESMALVEQQNTARGLQQVKPNHHAPGSMAGVLARLQPKQQIHMELDETFKAAFKLGVDEVASHGGESWAISGGDEEGEVCTFQLKDTPAPTTLRMSPLVTKKHFGSVAKNLHMYQPFLRFQRPKSRYEVDPEIAEMEIRKSVEGLGEDEELPPELKPLHREKHLDLKDVLGSLSVAIELEGHLGEEEHLQVIHTGKFWHRQYMEALKANGVHEDLERAVDAFDLYGFSTAIIKADRPWTEKLLAEQWWAAYMNKHLFWNWDAEPLSVVSASTFLDIFGKSDTSGDMFFAHCLTHAADAEQLQVRMELRELRAKPLPPGGKALSEEEYMAKLAKEGRKFLPTTTSEALAYIQPSAFRRREESLFNEDEVDAQCESIQAELDKIHSFIPSVPKLYSTYCFYRNKLSPMTVQDTSRRSLLATFCSGLVAVFLKSCSGYGGWMLYWCTSPVVKVGEGCSTGSGITPVAVEVRTDFERRAVLLQWIHGVCSRSSAGKLLARWVEWLLQCAWESDHRHFLQPSEVCDRSFIRHLNVLTAGLDIPFWWPLVLSTLRLVKTAKCTPQWHLLGVAKADPPVIITDLTAQVLQGLCSLVMPITVYVPLEQYAVRSYKSFCPRPNHIVGYALALFSYKLYKARRAAPLQGIRHHLTVAMTSLWWMVPLRLLHSHGHRLAPQINAGILGGLKLLFKGGGAVSGAALASIGDELAMNQTLLDRSLENAASAGAQVGSGVKGSSGIKMSMVVYILAMGCQVGIDYVVRRRYLHTPERSIPAVRSVEEAEFLMNPTGDGNVATAKEMDRRLSLGVDAKSEKKIPSKSTDEEQEDGVGDESISTKNMGILESLAVKANQSGLPEGIKHRLPLVKSAVTKFLVQHEKLLKEKMASRNALVSLVEDVVVNSMSLAILLRHRSYTKALGFRAMMSVLMYAVEYSASKKFAK